jgi:hypothetical protein
MLGEADAANLREERFHVPGEAERIAALADAPEPPRAAAARVLVEVAPPPPKRRFGRLSR